MRRIEVADVLWAEVPTHLLEDAVDQVEEAICVICKLAIDIGATPASMLAYIEPEGPISLALVHRDCGDSHVIDAPAHEHPPESIDTAGAFRWRAHLRVQRPGAMLLWDQLEYQEGGVGRLARSLVETLGFGVAYKPLKEMDPPEISTLGARLQGDDLSLILTNPQVPAPEMVSFPGVVGGPWIEQARLDQAIVVVYGPLHLGRSPIGFSNVAVKYGEVVTATVPFWE